MRKLNEISTLSKPASPSSADNPPAAGTQLDQLVHALEARATFGLSPMALSLAFLDWAIHLANSPFWRIERGRLAVDQWRRLFASAGRDVIVPAAGDHRFQSAASQAPPFRMLEQAFLFGEEWWAAAGASPPGAAAGNARIVAFAMRQFVDVFSPSNIPFFNPEVINATMTENGQNLLRGAANRYKPLCDAPGTYVYEH